MTRYVYSFVRHPIYLGYSLFLLGLAVRSGELSAVVLALLFAAGLMLYTRFVEEPRLIRRFGDRYRAYRARVGFLLPRRGSFHRENFRLNFILLFALVLGRFLFRFFWRVRVEGLENLPEEGPYLLVANHTNLADPFLIGIFLTRPVRFIASDELFRRPILRLLFGFFFGALKKRRWNRDIGALRQAERWLARGEVVGIFPEGGRTWDGSPIVVGDEVYRFLHHCRVPVVATAVIGGHEAMPRWASWPARARVKT
ncbi:MAG: 1-acyl-sn-glycerol-3-phosphate acyltransferase [Bacillota bacterium]